jgi:hypothetical protein
MAARGPAQAVERPHERAARFEGIPRQRSEPGEILLERGWHRRIVTNGRPYRNRREGRILPLPPRTLMYPDSLSHALARREFLSLCATAYVALASPPAKINEEIVAGLEVGTSQVRVAVGKRGAGGTVEVLGLGAAPAPILGPALDADRIGPAIRAALVDAEEKTDVMIGEVILALGGNYSGDAELDASEEDRELCVFDAHSGALRALGASGAQRLGKHAHVVPGQWTQVRARIECLAPLRVAAAGVVLLAAASAEAVLNEGGKQRGALVLDFGAHRTGYAEYQGGLLCRSGCIPFGCYDPAVPKEEPKRLSAGLEFLLDAAVGRGRALPSTMQVLLTGGRASQAFIHEGTEQHFRPHGIAVQLAVAKGFTGERALLEDPRHSTALGLVKAALTHRLWPI